MPVDLKGKPFYLNEKQIKWVDDTIKDMSVEEKIGQMLCPGVQALDKKTVRHLTQVTGAGSLMIRPFPVKSVQEKIRDLQVNSKVPMLISANLENGGCGAVNEGTYFAMPMGCAATGNVENGYRLGKISCREAAAIGINWGFAPIIDIDNNYRNPITNIRAFSSKPEEVLALARGYVRAAKEEGIAPTIKHFPGDGCDERDQHLLVSVNDCSAETWMDTYGKIYQTLIDEGAPVVMSGHIAQPAMVRKLHPEADRELAYRPASQSKILMTELLREKMGFNGLIVTDSTLMTGYMQCMPRRKAVPYSVECGADIILFNRVIDEDAAFLKQGIEDGIVSMRRVDEAVTRILALKAMLGLPEKKQDGTIVPKENPMQVIGLDETKQWTKECADAAVTLIKDNKKVLPLSPQKTKRIYLNVIENYVSNHSVFAKDIKERLEKEGFSVTLRKRKLNLNQDLMKKGIPTPNLLRIMNEVMAGTEAFVSQYDLAMIVLNMETVSNATVVRIEWEVMSGLGNDIPWYAGEIPLVAVSTANPYHLLDLPMVHTYINAYSNNKETLDAVFEKIMGRSGFKGISPVDAFCGHEDTML